MADKDKGVVTFPENQEYLERIAAAKSSQVPVGGAPMPQMPRLDQPPDQQARWQGVQNRQTLSPEQMAEMQQQGRLMPGVGAAYPFNQPAMQGQPQQPQPARPQQAAQQQISAPEGQEFANPPRPAGAGISPQTAQQLAEVMAANAAGTADGKAKTDADAKSASDKAAAKVKAELDDLDDQFDVDELGNKVRNMFVNTERREAIEKRCAPMDLEDLLVQQEVRQDVPIVPGKFEVTYRSMSGEEDLAITRKIFGVKGSNQYILDLLAMMRLCAATFAINRRPLPTHMKDGELNDDLFQAKMKVLMKFPIQILADMSVNYAWFDRRVKKLTVIDELKGF